MNAAADKNDSKLNELLLKARKSADASFGASHWADVLRACGFQFEVTRKKLREILEVRITAPNGATLLVEKDPRYKRIGFGMVHLPAKGHVAKRHDDGTACGCSCGLREWPCFRTPHTSLKRWAEEQGFSIPDLAARALGMPTLAEERNYKEYEKRDWTHTGSCGVCCQNIKMEALGKRQVLVLHGYRRPGDGSAHGECFGRGYPPHELAPDAARDFLKKVLIPQRDNTQKALENLQTGKISKICIRQPDFVRDREGEYVKRGEPLWDYYLKQKIESTQRELKYAERTVAEFALKVAEWKLDELPEFKQAKLFGKKGAP